MTEKIHPKRQEIVDRLEEMEEDALLADDCYDNGIIGLGEVCVTCASGGVTTRPVVVYDVEACINCLVDQDGMTYEEASEFFYYNCDRGKGYYHKDTTPAPIFMSRLESAQE